MEALIILKDLFFIIISGPVVKKIVRGFDPDTSIIYYREKKDELKRLTPSGIYCIHVAISITVCIFWSLLMLWAGLELWILFFMLFLGLIFQYFTPGYGNQ